MLMDNSQYLDNEFLRYSNYPELAQVTSDIYDIQNYLMSINDAIEIYNSNTYDRVNINAQEASKYIAMCRSVCDTLGSATNVCFDVLLEIREVQRTLQDLVYIRRRFGDQYIGTPTELQNPVLTSTEDDSGVI